MALGVARGERVVLWATNVPEWVVLQFAVAKIGAILVTANTSLRARDIDYLLRQSEAATLITIRGFRDVDYVSELTAIGALEGRLSRPRAAHLHRRSHARRLHRRIEQVRLRSGRARLRRRTRCAQRVHRRRRRDQHAVHVGHDRLSQRRDALQPQHRQQRRGARAGARLHAGRSPLPVRAAVPLLRLRDRRARRLHARRLPVSGGRVRPAGRCSRPCTASAAPRSTACRRCSSRSSSVRTSRDYDLTSLRTGVMAGALCPEPLMRRVMTRDAPARDHDRLRHDRVVAGDHHDAARFVDRAALADGRPGAARARGQDRRSRHRRDARRRRARRAVLPRLQRDEGLLQQPRGDARGDRRRRLAAHRRRGEPAIRTAASASPAGSRTSSSAAARTSRRRRSRIACASTRRSPTPTSTASRTRFSGKRSPRRCAEAGADGCSAEELIAWCASDLARFKVPRYVDSSSDFPMTASGKIQKFKLREEHEDQLETLN